jgi:hypothetical protein
VRSRDGIGPDQTDVSCGASTVKAQAPVSVEYWDGRFFVYRAVSARVTASKNSKNLIAPDEAR